MDIIIVNTIITISTATLSSFTRIRWWPEKYDKNLPAYRDYCSMNYCYNNQLLLQLQSTATTTTTAYTTTLLWQQWWLQLRPWLQSAQVLLC